MFHIVNNYCCKNKGVLLFTTIISPCIILISIFFSYSWKIKSTYVWERSVIQWQRDGGGKEKEKERSLFIYPPTYPLTCLLPHSPDASKRNSWAKIQDPGTWSDVPLQITGPRNWSNTCGFSIFLWLGSSTGTK